MNKQEAIKQVEQMGEYEHFVDELISKKLVLNIISQIHEPKKVVVPKFVAEWLNGCKRSGWYLRKVIFGLNADEKVGDWAYDENDYLIPEKVDVIARAWLDGYEIEREKLYTVEIPNPNNTSANVFCLRKDGGKIHISKQNYKTYKQSRYCQLTESEIKQDFEWAWDAGFAKPVEVE
ncbi:DUF1642 domain-containing protein [Streptococcus suis]